MRWQAREVTPVTRHPDGGLRRFIVLTDGRGPAADSFDATGMTYQTRASKDAVDCLALHGHGAVWKLPKRLSGLPHAATV